MSHNIINLSFIKNKNNIVNMIEYTTDSLVINFILDDVS